jgi:hypothetical protein
MADIYMPYLTKLPLGTSWCQHFIANALVREGDPGYDLHMYNHFVPA